MKQAEGHRGWRAWIAAGALIGALLGVGCGSDAQSVADATDVDAWGDSGGSGLGSAHPCTVTTHRDGALAEKVTFAYDRLGHVRVEQRDEDGDGQKDWRKESFYDLSDRLSRSELDDDGDGDLDEIVTLTYDDLDLVVTEDIDRDADGTPDGVRTYDYDGAGNLRGTAYDANLDGTIERRTELYYDEDFRLIAERVYLGPTKVPDESTTYVYDYRGRLEIKEEAQRFEGILREFRTIWSYDDEDRIVQQTVDQGADGTPELAIDFDYDKTTGLKAEEAVDLGVDGDVDERTVFSWDGEGRLIKSELDEGADGSVEETVTYDYGCWQ